MIKSFSVIFQLSIFRKISYTQFCFSIRNLLHESFCFKAFWSSLLPPSRLSSVFISASRTTVYGGELQSLFINFITIVVFSCSLFLDPFKDSLWFFLCVCETQLRLCLKTSCLIPYLSLQWPWFGFTQKESENLFPRKSWSELFRFAEQFDGIKNVFFLQFFTQVNWF